MDSTSMFLPNLCWIPQPGNYLLNPAPCVGNFLSSLCMQKKRHRQLKTVICGRCKLLSHGHMITAVGGRGGYPGGKQFVTAEELRDRLSHLRNEKTLIVKLVSLLHSVIGFPCSQPYNQNFEECVWNAGSWLWNLDQKIILQMRGCKSLAISFCLRGGCWVGMQFIWLGR